MAELSTLAQAGEALVLGLATGPVCLASCGPVVLPWMMVQPHGLRIHSQQLAAFLGARLAGYLVFAAAVWYVGAAISRTWVGRSWILGGIQVLLAVGLLIYATGWPHARPPGSAPQRVTLVQIGERPQPPRVLRTGALALGFLTGINLCPPFLVAGVRAAQLATLPAALTYFAFFFIGTSVWFAPFLGLGWVRRTPSVVLVARMTALLLACWYGFSGFSILIERAVYG
jgi:sulfite exporter TauE/SafE